VREIGDDLMAVMARQTGITLSELKKIIAGKMASEGY
jgi:hypothetical protein